MAELTQDQFVDYIKNISVLELSQLVKSLEQELGVSAAAAMPVKGSSALQPCTPTVFCAVTAVITLIPKTPNWWKVLRSAWIPAPPPESEPAIVSTCRKVREAIVVPIR